jgi:trafficking protein particle complex subunit 4
MFLHLFVISRSGGLIYNKDLSASAPKLSVNGWLIMGSTFHGLHSIAAQVRGGVFCVCVIVCVCW